MMMPACRILGSNSRRRSGVAGISLAIAELFGHFLECLAEGGAHV
jgi:hypothetical protein